jgi:hypothetical protein
MWWLLLHWSGVILATDVPIIRSDTLWRSVLKIQVTPRVATKTMDMASSMQQLHTNGYKIMIA